MDKLCLSPEGWGPLSPSRPVDFTPCFQYGVLVTGLNVAFIAVGLLRLTALGQLPGLPSVFASGKMLTAKLAISNLAFLLSLAQLHTVYTLFSGISTHALALAAQTAAVALAIKLHHKEQHHNPVASTVLLLFWLTSMVFSLMALRTTIALGYLDIHVTLIASNALFALLSFTLLVLESQSKPDCIPELLDDDVDYAMFKTPEEKANIFSRMVFHWLSPLINQGLTKQLEINDIWSLGYKYRPDVATENFQQHWQPELKSESPSLLKAVGRTYGLKWMLAMTLRITSDLVSFLNPVLLSYLIGFVAKHNTDQAEPIQNGYFYAIAMFVAELVTDIIFRQYFLQCQKLECLAKTSLTTALFRKALSLSNDAKQKYNVGNIVTHLTVDTSRIIRWMTSSAFLLLSVPLKIIITLVLLYKTLGWSTFAGVVIMSLSFPATTYLGRLSTGKVKQLIQYQDKRIKTLEEVLGGMKVIKLYAWEPSFITKLNKIRVELELGALKGYGNIQTVMAFISNMSTFAVTFASFALYSIFDNKSHGPLNPQLVFVSLALFDKLKNPLFRAPYLISGLFEAKVSYQRIYDFLTASEIDFTSIDHMPYDRYSRTSSPDDVLVKVENGCFKWLSDAEPTLTGINIQCQKNELVAVIGKVGSGKSSLVAAILGDMMKDSGHVFTQGNISYVPQLPWIMNATLRDNILFGNELDQELYDKVISACALRPDLDMLPAGDMTEIGEKGINLSGGQKARVSLARAVYARADVYILDDPLAAVDAHVGKHIFTHVLGPNGLLQSRARILVTNAMQYLKYADNVVMLQDGKIIEQSPLALAMAKNGAIYEFVHKFIEHKSAGSETSSMTSSMSSVNLADTSRTLSVADVSQARKNTLGSPSADSINAALARGGRSAYHIQPASADAEAGRTIATEVNAKGKVSWGTYITYIKSCGLRNSLLLLAAVLLTSISNVGSKLWLKHWASSNTETDSAGMLQLGSAHSVKYYLIIYGVLGIVSSAANAAQSLLLWSRCSINAATSIHQRMLHSVMRSPMAYFDVTPVGRILNRFSSDLQHCDISLPYNVLYLVSVLVSVVSAVSVIGASTPLVFVFMLLLSYFYFNIQNQYMYSSRELKRLQSSTRSPVIAHFQESINGVSSIRAYNQQPRFIFENERMIEQNVRAIYFYDSLDIWLAIRLQALGGIIMLGTCMVSVISLQYLGHGDAGMVGLAVSYALSLTSSLKSSVEAYTGMENSMVQMERLSEYADLTAEAPETIEDNQPEAAWPSSGAVEFKDYSTRYREGLDLVLKGLSFSVQPKQKVGIVGRTGAGKSSLTLALFRIIEGAGGDIIIDGQPISQYGVADVRNKLSIIPQDPVLFAGTVRENLDPFNKYSDQEIWVALEHAHLADFIRTKDDRLEFQITPGGENFSVGQRQLICLARALLKQAKILVLDEATAAIDNATDSIIQESIRREFKNCTVLTIAHRVNTIIDSDMILVMDGGKAAEYDTPANLLQNKDSLFAKLVEESKSNNAE